MKYKLLVIVAVLTFVAAGMAETGYLHANVPFSFVVDGVSMPAGSYQIERTDIEGALLLAGPSRTVIVPTDSAQNIAGAPESMLMFKEYGGHYYLSQIWAEGQSRGYSVPLSHKDFLIAQRGATVQVAAAR